MIFPLKVTFVLLVIVLSSGAEVVPSNCQHLSYDYGYATTVGSLRVSQGTSPSVDVELQLAYWTWPNSPSGSLTYDKGAGSGTVEFRLELSNKDYPPPTVTRLTSNGRVLCSARHNLYSVQHQRGQVIGEMTLSSYVKSQSSQWSYSDSDTPFGSNMGPFFSNNRPSMSSSGPISQDFLHQLHSSGFSQTDMFSTFDNTGMSHRASFDIEDILNDIRNKNQQTQHTFNSNSEFTENVYPTTTPVVYRPRPPDPPKRPYPQRERPQALPPRFRPQTEPPPPPTTTPPPVYRPPPTTAPPPPPVRPKPASPSSPQCGSIGLSVSPLIIHGDTYTRGDWPWLVAIYTTFDGKLTYICCGTLFTDRHVVTAAHCMLLGEIVNLKPKDIVVRVGAFNLDTWGDDVQRSLSDAKVHDDYNSTTLANDILIMTFSKPVEFSNYIRPICLWNFDTSLDNIANNIGVVTGWGKDENGLVGRGPPKVTRVPIVANSTCRASHSDFHKFTNNGNTFCAGKQDGTGPCNGDSGGGLYLMRNRRWYIRGLVSLALLPENGLKDHCNLDEYLVFTDVAKFLPWITRIMRR